MKKSTIILSATKIAVVALGLALAATSCKAEDSAKDNGSAEATEQTEAEVDDSGTVYNNSIVYIQMDKIYAEYGKAIDLSAALEKKVNNTQAEIERRGKKLENEVKAFQNKINKGLITRSVAELEGEKLQKKEADFNQYAGKKQQELQEETMVTTNQINDAIYTFIQKFNAEKGYAMILTSQGGVPVMAGNPALDITNEVIEGLNAEYHPEEKK